MRPYYIKTAFQPEFEFEDAKRLCREIGAELTVLELDALSDPAVAANPADRCYHCKRNLFGTLAARALADGYTLLLDGTNASDDAGDRPGMRALRELSVRSPLRECGLTKVAHPRTFARSWPVHVGQAGLCLSRHARTHRRDHHGGKAAKNGAR